MHFHRIFVYGTLMSEHPEHKAFCPKPERVLPATIRGTLFQLKEGYPILKIQTDQIVGQATENSDADWEQASKRPARRSAVDSLVVGEILEYPLGNPFLGTMDQWECFTPGQDSFYQRVLVHAQSEATTEPLLCWVYACTTPPPDAVELSDRAWKRPAWLTFEQGD